VKKRMDFYRRVAVVCKGIPYGRVATYGQIALLCGKPKNSRQVGYALNKGKAGENVPAFRVVNHKGVLSGAAAFETPGLQKMLLLEEKIAVEDTPEGARVNLREYGWHNSMEEAENFREIFKQEGI